MSNQQSGTPSEGLCSPQGCTTISFAHSDIRGHHSGNTGSHNTTNCGNTNCGNTINFNNAGRKSSPSYPKIMQCLYKCSYEGHRNRVREPVEGTCTWATKHPKYVKWLGKRTSALLWISADPGCGKSVIASFLVGHLRVQTTATICYFFFSDDSDEQKTATFALSAILHQLFKQKKHLFTHAKEEFKEKGKRFTEETDTLWNVLVRAVEDRGCGDVICVLDGLDECEEVTRAHLIGYLNSLSVSHTSRACLKFIVTSRPYHRIDIALGSPATTIRLKGEDEVKAITMDVNRVITEGIENLESYWGQHGSLGYLRDLLEASADRTFLWVSLILDILKESEADSREEFTKIVSTAPHDLAELYTKILDKSTHPDKARRVLNIVVAAARPLTLQEINVALQITRNHKSIKDLKDPSPGFARIVKNFCGLFVRILDSKVYLVHQTAREFLMKGTSSGRGNWQYTLRSRDYSYILADICISYLSLQDFETKDFERWNTTRYIPSEAVDKYPLLDYAAKHWAGHLRDSQDRQWELFEFTKPICARGSTRSLTWLKIYWQNDQLRPFPDDLSHLMIASWFGQRMIVKRLLAEGRDINARSKFYGTALNVAALRADEFIARMLLDRGVNAYMGRKEYNILRVKGPLFLR